MLEIKLSALPLPHKIFATFVLLMLAFGMATAGAQTYVKQIRVDIQKAQEGASEEVSSEASGYGEQGEKKPLLDDWKFQWLLTYTHIHSFSMGFIFFFAGALYLMTAASARAKILWSALPFLGIVMDLAGLWLRNYAGAGWMISQYVGGTLMGVSFLVIFFTVMKDLWGSPISSQ